jgi:hypothetical protein
MYDEVFMNQAKGVSARKSPGKEIKHDKQREYDKKNKKYKDKRL